MVDRSVKTRKGVGGGGVYENPNDKGAHSCCCTLPMNAHVPLCRSLGSPGGEGGKGAADKGTRNIFDIFL